jgi:putative hydrolase of the HAD superfamily
VGDIYDMKEKTMRTETKIKCLFLDIGGVLLTDGWNHEARRLAADKFNLNLKEMEDRHHLTFDTYEVGRLTLDEYLARIVFYKKRSFPRAQFEKFMFAQSKPFPEMIDLVCKLKEKYRLKIAVVSNEGRELNLHRIQKFELGRFVDFFISSCFVHFRKPDTEIYRLALDVAQVQSNRVIYIEDRPMFVQVAESLGIHGIRQVDYQTTRVRLAEFGLEILA